MCLQTHLGKFLLNNYKQALKILQGEEALRLTMKVQGIANTAVFYTWLREEKEYLQGLKQEPLQETLEMDYYQRLVVLYHYEYVYHSIVWRQVDNY